MLRTKSGARGARPSEAIFNGIRPSQLAAEFRQVLVRLGPSQLQIFERVGHRSGDDIIAIPFVIGGHDVPWRVMRAAEVKGVLVSLLKLRPMCSHLEVCWLEFPVLARVIEAGFEPL